MGSDNIYGAIYDRSHYSGRVREWWAYCRPSRVRTQKESRRRATCCAVQGTSRQNHAKWAFPLKRQAVGLAPSSFVVRQVPAFPDSALREFRVRCSIRPKSSGGLRGCLLGVGGCCCDSLDLILRKSTSLNTVIYEAANGCAPVLFGTAHLTTRQGFAAFSLLSTGHRCLSPGGSDVLEKDAPGGIKHAGGGRNSFYNEGQCRIETHMLQHRESRSQGSRGVPQQTKPKQFEHEDMPLSHDSTGVKTEYSHTVCESVPKAVERLTPLNKL